MIQPHEYDTWLFYDHDNGKFAIGDRPNLSHYGPDDLHWVTFNSIYRILLPDDYLEWLPD